MGHKNSVFHGLMKHLPWADFERLVEKHKADHRVRRLDTKSQFVAMLFAQFSGAESLREVEAGLLSQRHRLYHLGTRSVARSTLSDANATRPAAVFAELFAVMVTRAGRSGRRHMRDAVRILDATKVSLSGLGSDWARITDRHRAAKLHLVYDPDQSLPVRAEITRGTVNDITPAKAFPVEPGATYISDMAYYDYGWWSSLHRQGCRIVSRLKRHTKLSDAVERPGEKSSHILSDRIGHLPQRMARSRKNPMAAPVRELQVTISTGKVIRVVTNDLEAPADEIADLYKQRWQIELFFKWVKQNLKIKHMLGASENAVRIQLFVALIAFLSLRTAMAAQKAVRHPKQFARLIRLNLIHQRTLEDLKRPYKPPPDTSNQLAWNFPIT